MNSKELTGVTPEEYKGSETGSTLMKKANTCQVVKLSSNFGILLQPLKVAKTWDKSSSLT